MNFPMHHHPALGRLHSGRKALFLLPVLAALSACSEPQFDSLGKEPPLSPVGSGLAVAYNPEMVDFGANREPVRHYNSLWSKNSDAVFSDVRASKPGDVVTVNITMDDSATLANSSDRSRKANSSLAGGFGFGTNAFGNANVQANGSTSTQGQGTVDRSEKIGVSVATVVSRVLPNGNLLISGSQEVRVNAELRLLNVSGIIRQNDISSDNTITYDKIAEARITYGGKGRISEVQQPGWGQQIFDAVTPY